MFLAFTSQIFVEFYKLFCGVLIITLAGTLLLHIVREGCHENVPKYS
jgi:hypothetical protein